MNTGELEGFRYADMMACLVDIQYGINTTATFRIFLPPTSDEERIYKECERIPVDIMFRYLVAIHHDLTVLDIDTRVVMTSSEDDSNAVDQYALYATCRCVICTRYAYATIQKDETTLFPSANPSEIIHTSTFIDTIPICGSDSNGDDDGASVNGIFHITAQTYREIPANTVHSRLCPYGINISIRCINAQAIEVSGIHYDIYEHNSIYRIINDIIKESAGILYSWMIYETTDGFTPLKDMVTHMTYHFIHLPNETIGGKRVTDKISVYVMVHPDGLFNLKFDNTGIREIACVPYDITNKMLAQYHNMNWAIPAVTFDAGMRRMESMYSYLMSNPDYTLVSACTSCSGRAIDDMMYFVFNFEPALIDWTTGIDPSESMCDYFISHAFDGVDIAFPINGQNPRRGVLFYVRYPIALGIHYIRQQFPLTSRVPIYARIIAVNSGYAVMAFTVDEFYDSDTLGAGDLDKFFPHSWFPTINDDLMFGSRGKLNNWPTLPDELKADAIKFIHTVVKYMFAFQRNELMLMNALDVKSHEEILSAWMNCVGLPYFWRPYAMGAISTLFTGFLPPKKKEGFLSRIFRKKSS